ncbi:neuropathy target esterase sws isoform X1 [Spodoptera litura]|uniref:Neuropathy target esterase sws n=1 Tax=Spodoptera litura TaxID=69820 RepID=A0A9J7IQH2_SPOLT|nr:neuropathy target esterase sws isoform X1 [Spodoptera litura]
MDVVGLLNNINDNSNMFAVKTWTSEWSNNFQDNQLMWSICGCLLVSLVVVFFYYYRRWRSKELTGVIGGVGATGDAVKRFRKRDKMLFYGRRMLRKVKSISNSGQGRKRRAVMRFARKLLQLKKETAPEQLKVLEPPAEYLEEDLTSDDRVPPDALYMLHSIRVFGHFEKPVFLMLCKHTEILNLPAGAFLFKVGDTDENVYVVQNGRVNVYITNQDGSSLSLKVVRAGESVTSLLSFTDVLTGHSQPYKTVNAKALEDSQVIKLPMRAFQEVFKEYPDIFVRVIQIIMVRLQRVTFTALHQYLGLSAELVNPGRDKRRPNTVSSSPGKAAKMSTADSSANMHSPHHSDRAMSEHLNACQEPSHPASSPIHIQGRRQKPDMVPDIASNTPQNQPDVQPTPPLQRAREGSSFKKHNTDNLDEQTLIQIATDAFVKELGLDSDAVLRGNVQVRDLPAGTYIMKEESHKDVALVYLLSGALLVSQRVAEGEGEVHMFTAYPGEVEGGLAVLTGEPSFFSIRAKHFSRIGLLSKTTVYSIMRERPSVVLHIANTVVRRLSPFVRQVDFALDWVFLESGRAVYRQDEESGSTFIVLSGRLRSVITHPNGKKELVGEYGKGDLVGIVEMVTQTRRSTTVMAVRDSELAKLPEGLFNAIKLRFPVVVTRLINLLGHRILGSWQKPTAGLGGAAAIEPRPSQHNFSTVAVVPVSDDVPLTAFTYELYHSLSAIGPTVRLTSDVIRKLLGLTIMDPNNEYRLSSWLAQQEDKHKVALYQCDPSLTQWTQRCIRQADCILIVALGDKQPSIGKIEKEIERLAIRTQKELVLLHREGGPQPAGTVHWLNMRSWVSQHHHVRCPHRMFTRKSQYRISELYSKVLMSEASVHSDFSRLARWLTGTSVGLVLGGGGARGAAHVGMVRAIQEAGIPIDMVGGVSIGAFMGALWCMERNITTVTQKAREWSQKMTQWGKQLLDLTYPATSMFSGRQFNATIRSTFGDVHIEDLWLPYFTVTTDISSSCMRVHRHGSLWRYIRASMSLSGYMPPLCDPLDGHLLLDGGYVNNLPADVMRSLGAKHILAIDVGSQDDTDLTNYGDDLSGWWLLWKRWNPFTTPVKVPNLPDIQSRLAYVSCNRQLEEVKKSDYCEYIRPPIDAYKTLQFGSFDEIREVGYRHGAAYFEGQRRGGGGGVSGAAAEGRRHDAQPSLTEYRYGTTYFEGQRRVCARRPSGIIDGRKNHPQPSITDYTFTDLAQMVCSVRTARDVDNDSSSSSDYEEDQRHFEGYASEPSAGILEMSSSVEDGAAAWISDTELEGLRTRRVGGSLSLSEDEIDSEAEVYDPLNKRGGGR